MSQQNNSDDLEYSSGSSHHHSSGSSHHHHSSGSSHRHHSSGSSHHHNSSGSSHHHHSSGSSHHHHSSGSSHHHHSSGSSHSDYYYESELKEEEKNEAKEKIKRIGQSFERRIVDKENDYDDDDSFEEYKDEFDDYELEHIIEKKQSKELKKGKKKGKKKNKALKIVLGIFIFFLLLILIAAITLLIMIRSGKKDMLNYDDADIQTVDDAESEDDGKTIRYKGKIYRLNEDITSIACLGIDKNEINKKVVNGRSGQADTIIVLAFDTKTGNATLIPIPRDTIGEIEVYADDGSFKRIEKTQICLSYAYGSDGESSCRNVVSSVQKIIFGLPIQAYAALDLAGIAPLNDAVGGVTVTPPDNFEDVFVAGRPIRLKGEMAMRFVRSRDTTKVDSNLVRMNHQKIYIQEFTKTAVRQARQKPSTVTDLYNLAMNYSYTDVDFSDASFLVSKFITVGTAEFSQVSVPGKMIASKEDGFSEYYIDREKFFEVILSVYYDVIGTY